MKKFFYLVIAVAAGFGAAKLMDRCGDDSSDNMTYTEDGYDYYEEGDSTLVLEAYAEYTDADYEFVDSIVDWDMDSVYDPYHRPNYEYVEEASKAMPAKQNAVTNMKADNKSEIASIIKKFNKSLPHKFPNSVDDPSERYFSLSKVEYSKKDNSLTFMTYYDSNELGYLYPDLWIDDLMMYNILFDALDAEESLTDLLKEEHTTITFTFTDKSKIYNTKIYDMQL